MTILVSGGAGVELSAENKRQFWIPEGFAQGFVTLSEHAEIAAQPLLSDAELFD